ncbi:MAG: DUF3090 family protein [Chloroflexota bacterium]
MAGEQVEFGGIDSILADAVGPPGRRAFRLVVTGRTASAWIWIEREQLQALAMLAEQLLTGLPALDIRSASVPPSSAASPSGPVVPPDVEFRAGQLALGYEEAHRRYVLLAHDVEAEDSDGPRLTCNPNRQQLRALADGIAPLLAAGRPRCPTCEAPLGEGKHLCPRANGHAARAAES